MSNKQPNYIQQAYDIFCRQPEFNALEKETGFNPVKKLEKVCLLYLSGTIDSEQMLSYMIVQKEIVDKFHEIKVLQRINSDPNLDEVGKKNLKERLGYVCQN